VQQSPLFLSHDYTMNGVNVGPTQYIDAFQQANFWSLVGGMAYHTLLSTTTLPLIPLSVPPGSGQTVRPGTSGRCGNIGLVEVNWFDQWLTGTLFPAFAAQGVNPTTFPIIVLSNVVLYDTVPSRCCFLGYHGAVGAVPQTYAVVEFDTTGAFGTQTQDTVALSHEIAEWMDDPLAANLTPPWGSIGQVQTCENDLEVADPLSGTPFPSVTMPNGYAYHLQELAFFSWFFGAPSLGAGGLFSNHSTFRGDARLCPPGGTNGGGAVGSMVCTWGLYIDDHQVVGGT